MQFQKAPSSRFPFVDFTSRVLSKGFSEQSLATVLANVTNGSDKKICEKLWKKVLFLGEVEDAEVDLNGGKEKEFGKIGFSTMNDISPLKVGEFYE